MQRNAVIGVFETRATRSRHTTTLANSSERLPNILPRAEVTARLAIASRGRNADYFLLASCVTASAMHSHFPLCSIPVSTQSCG